MKTVYSIAVAILVLKTNILMALNVESLMPQLVHNSKWVAKLQVQFKSAISDPKQDTVVASAVAVDNCRYIVSRHSLSQIKNIRKIVVQDQLGQKYAAHLVQKQIQKKQVLQDWALLKKSLCKNKKYNQNIALAKHFFKGQKVFVMGFEHNNQASDFAGNKKNNMFDIDVQEATIIERDAKGQFLLKAQHKNAVLKQGASGGAVLNEQGELLAIYTGYRKWVYTSGKQTYQMTAQALSKSLLDLL